MHCLRSVVIESASGRVGKDVVNVLPMHARQRYGSNSPDSVRGLGVVIMAGAAIVLLDSVYKERERGLGGVMLRRTRACKVCVNEKRKGVVTISSMCILPAHR